jgi:hypothetical protein
MKVPYTHPGNVDSFLSRRHEPGDRLVSHTRTAEVTAGEAAIAVAKRLCALHSGDDDDPRVGATHRSRWVTCS